LKEIYSDRKVIQVWWGKIAEKIPQLKYSLMEIPLLNDEETSKFSLKYKNSK